MDLRVATDLRVFITVPSSRFNLLAANFNMSLFLLLISCCIGLSAIYECSSAHNLLIITVTPSGTDSPLCLRGEESCSSFDYVLTNLANPDLKKPLFKRVSVVVTYSQELVTLSYEVGTIVDLTILGQGDVVFTCTTGKDVKNYEGFTIKGSDYARIHIKGIQIEKCSWNHNSYITAQQLIFTWFDKVKLEDCVIRDGVNVAFKSIRHTIIDTCTFSNISSRTNDITKQYSLLPIISIGQSDRGNAVQTVPRSIVMRNMEISGSNGTSPFTIYLPCVPVPPYDPSRNINCSEGTGIRQIIVENSTFFNNALASQKPSPTLYLSKESGNVPVNFTIKDCHFDDAFPPLTLQLSSAPDIHVDMNILDSRGWQGLNVIQYGGEATVHSNIDNCY